MSLSITRNHAVTRPLALGLILILGTMLVVGCADPTELPPDGIDAGDTTPAEQNEPTTQAPDGDSGSTDGGDGSDGGDGTDGGDGDGSADSPGDQANDPNDAPNDDPNDATPGDPPPTDVDPNNGVSKFIAAAEGGTITHDSGMTLEIPPDALSEDATIGVIPLDDEHLEALPEGVVAGVVLQPSGLTFDSPLTLRVPLPEPWTEDDAPIELYFPGDDPSLAYATGGVVALEDDGATAVFQIEHFSGTAVAEPKFWAQQCHVGTRYYMLEQFAARGCDFNMYKTRVLAKYPSIKISPRTASDLYLDDDREIQALLGTFFDDVGGFEKIPDSDPSQNLLSAEALNLIVGRMNEEKLDESKYDYEYNAAFCFWPETYGMPAGPDRFFVRPAHSVALELRGNLWHLRNSLNLKRTSPLLQYLDVNQGRAPADYTNLFWWPLMDVNAFRQLRTFEGVEIQHCGAADCLVGKPGVFLRPAKDRSQSWGAIRMYVERQDNNPCNRLTGCWYTKFDADDDVAHVLLRFNHAGDLDSMWFGLPPKEPDPAKSEYEQLLFVEIMRFTTARPNSPEVADDLAEVSQVINLDPSQRSFTGNWLWKNQEDDGTGGTYISAETHYAVNNATFCQSTPDEYFSADISLLKIKYELDENSVPVQQPPETINATVRFDRVKRPITEDEGRTGLTQEQFGDYLELVLAEYLLDSLDGLMADLPNCGDGAYLAVPLIAVTLTGLKLHGGRRHRRC